MNRVNYLYGIGLYIFYIRGFVTYFNHAAYQLAKLNVARLDLERRLDYFDL